jgi:hypothetical protein
MGVAGGPDLIQDGLVLSLDASDRNSYVSGSTTWFDLSGLNNSGSLTNGPTFNTGSLGSIVFDGTNDLIIKDTTFSGLPSSQLSVFTWIKFNNVNAYYELIAQGRTPTNFQGEWVLGLVNTAKILFFDYNNGYGFGETTSNATILANQWYHVGFVKNQTSGRFYIQGSLDRTITGIDVTYTNTGYVIGGGYRDSSYYLSGNIASVQIYNRALSAQEVLQNYNAQKSKFGL